MALLAYIQSVRKIAVLLSALLGATLLQYCIFLGFATSFLRFPSHVSAFSLRLVFRGSFMVYVRIFVCFVVSSRFFAYLVLVSRGLFSAFFLRFLVVFSCFFCVFFAFFCVFFAFFLRFFAF